MYNASHTQTFPSIVDSTDTVTRLDAPSLVLHSNDEKVSVQAKSSINSSDRETTCSIVANPSFDETTTQQYSLSTLHLLVIHIGAALTLFLATTDATIVSTSLPTISSDLEASAMQYTWVGVAYMLTQTAFQPLYGRISDLVGRKNMLFFSIVVFATGSALCGAAPSIIWLIASRALAGIGGGGIVSSVWVITAEIVAVDQRAIWSQALSITWSCSAVAGPLLGGVFSQDGLMSNGKHLSWRWGFYINLPICFVAALMLLLSLRGVELKRLYQSSWKNFLQNFDFVGLFLFMAGTSCIIIGFSFATENGWGSVSTLTLIVCGAVGLVSGAIYERFTSRDCLFPKTAFSDLTTAIILIVSFLHNFAFNAGTFYLALYYQAANGSTPLEAGIKMLPYSLGSSLASMPVAWFIGYWQKRTNDTTGQNWMISFGLFISTLGFGMLNLLNEKSNSTSQILFPLIAGIGLGMLFHAPHQVFTRALKPQELATGTSAFFLVRFTGATIGLAVAGTIFYTQTKNRLPTNLAFRDSSPAINFSAITNLSPDVKASVLQIISSSIRTIWTVCAPCLGISFLMSFLLRKIPNTESSTLTISHTSTQSSADNEKV